MINPHQHENARITFIIDGGSMPERDGPYGDETPDYAIEYWEQGSLLVIIYGYGWGGIEDEYVFPMRKERSWHGKNTFGSPI